MTGFHSIQKSTFQKKKSHLNALGSNSDLDVKQVKVILGSSFQTNLVGPTSPMLHTKSQGHWPSGSGEEDF